MKILFETMVGSRAYGLEFADSDTDILRVVAHNLEHYFGLSDYKEAQHVTEGGDDVVIYDVRFFARLLLKGGFNTLIPLHLEGANVHPLFQEFVDNRREFFTTKAVNSFYGFAKRSYQEFQKTGNWKAAANGLFVLETLNSLALEGGVNFENTPFLRSVKCGLEDRGHVLWYYENRLYAYHPEILVGKPFVRPVEGAEKLLSGLCISVLASSF